MRLGPDDRPTGARGAGGKAGGSGGGSGSRQGPPTKRRKRERKGRRRSRLMGILYWSSVLAVWCVIGIAGLVAYHFAQLPPIDRLAVPKRPPNVAILAADGSLLANRGETGGREVRLAELPPHLPKAFIAIEDRRFYSHFGIDPIGIARAMARNLSGSGGTQGGSTLTQQLAKNLFLTQERTISRKIQEAILAIWLERNYSKDQILELYLNRVYFGSGAYGVEAAAQRYYQKPARGLTLAESATLAGLVQAPSRLAPNRNPDAAERRARLVLAAMAREGLITEGMAKVALSNPAEASRNAGPGSINYVADYVMDVVDDVLASPEGDIVVQTTIDPKIQAAAERTLVEALDRQGGKLSVSQGAILAMGPDGAIRAMVGGRDYAKSQFNRAAIAKRQPGSSFKPFVYLAAVEQGLTPDSVRQDAPISIKGWRPENYSREYFGDVTLRDALAKSLNTVAVRLGLEVGPRRVVETARRMGIESELQANASIALGTSEVTPLELVAAYVPLANGGIGVEPHVITRVKTSAGRTLYQRKARNRGVVISPAHVAMMNAMLRETLLSGTARKAEVPGWDAAGKTGTTQDFRDAWFAGYTAPLTAAVWLGNDDSAPMKKVTGGGLPSEIWSRFMREALAGKPPVPLPGGGWTTSPTAAPPVAGLPGPVDPARGDGSQSAYPVAPQSPAGAPVRLSDRAAPQGSPAREGVPRPPAPVGGSGDRAWTPPQERGLIDRIFGN